MSLLEIEGLEKKDYSNSRPLDVHKWSEYPEVNRFIDEIFKDLSSFNGNTKITKKLLKVLLLDLYVAWSSDPDLMIMFSRNNNAYQAKSRYNELHVGKKIIHLVDVCIDHNIIEQKIGFNDRLNGVSYQSRIWASDWLKECFKEARFNLFHLHSHPERETIVLKDRNKKLINYVDTKDIKRMRSLLHDYNELLARTHLDILDLETPLLTIGNGKKKMRLQINQQDKFVRRIFNNSVFDQGGRFYGGWWQRCPKEFRKRIMMDGIMTAEIDFSGLHVVLLYAQERIDYWSEVNEDPYALSQVTNIDPSINQRAAAKLLFLTALNAEDEKKTFHAFRYQSEKGSLEKKMTDEQLSSLLHNLKRKHEPIAYKMASGAGIDLMYVDSQITEYLIKAFTKIGCPILTVHDSYIVPFGYDRFLHQQMQKGFEQVTSISHPALEHTTDYYDRFENEPEPSSPPPEKEKQYSKVASKRHLKDLSLFRDFMNKPEREKWLPDWTMVY